MTEIKFKYLDVANEAAANKAIKTLQDKIVKDSLKNKVNAHIMLVAVVQSYIAHGSGTAAVPENSQIMKAIKVIRGIGSSMSQSAIQWIALSVPSLSWNEETKNFEHIKGHARKLADKITFTKGKGDKSVKVTANPLEVPFYDLEKEVKQSPVDVAKSLQALLNHAQKQALNVPQAERDILENALKSIKAIREDSGKTIAMSRTQGSEIVPANVVGEVKTKRKPNRKVKSLAEIATIAA